MYLSTFFSFRKVNEKMKNKGMEQRCTAIRVLGNGNWEDYMWPHQIDKTPLLDPEVLSFLTRLDLSKLTGIFENEEVLSMRILFKLDDEDLNKFGIKLVHRKIILEEISKLKQQPSSLSASTSIVGSDLLMDPDLLSFLYLHGLSKQTENFQKEKVLSMEVLLSLSDKDLEKINIMPRDRSKILRETSKLKLDIVESHEKMTSVKSPSNEGSVRPEHPPVKSNHQPSLNPKEKITLTKTTAPPSPLRQQQPMNEPPEVKKMSQVLPSPAVRQELASAPPFLLVSSLGPAADNLSDMLGLYRKTEEMREDRSVYTQMHDTKYGTNSHKLFKAQGVWTLAGRTVFMRATTPSESPTAAKWQFKAHETWHYDQALKVTSLSEKPDAFEGTISLSEDVKRDILEPGLEGLYKTDGSYCQGRPVLQHEGGLFTLYVWGSGHGTCLYVTAGVGNDEYFWSGTAPSQCPADPRAAKKELLKRGKYWRYRPKQGGYKESSGISVKFKTHAKDIEMSESSVSASPPPVQSKHLLPSPAVRQKPVSDPPFLLVSSSGPAADDQSDMLGLYRKTEEMREGRSVYTQMDDTKYGAYSPKKFIKKGVWSIENNDGYVRLRAATPSESPMSAKWQYYDRKEKTMQDDPTLTVTSLSEKPSCDCEVTISLSTDDKRVKWKKDVKGLYKAEDGLYHRGRPLLQHEGGSFTLSVRGGDDNGGFWCVRDGVRGSPYIWSWTAPSQCPADPRAARNELMKGGKYWRSKQGGPLGGYNESSGVSIRCKTHDWS